MSGPDRDLEDIAWLAAEIGAAPVAVVGLIRDDPAAFHPSASVGVGLLAGAGVADQALQVARRGAPLVVSDLQAAPPLMARAFAGVPMVSRSGVLGVILLFDMEPRPFLPWQVRAMERLAALVSRRLDGDRRREQTFGALAGGLALEIQALQQERGGPALQRAASLARDLLALCGHRSLRPAAVDLNALVAEGAARAAESSGRRLDVRLDRSIGPVAADGERLGRAIEGLVSRAAEADEAVPLATSEVAVAASKASPLPAGRYVLLTIGAAAGGKDPLHGWSFEAGTDEGITETRGMLRQSGARLGTAVGASGLPAFCIALPRAAD